MKEINIGHILSSKPCKFSQIQYYTFHSNYDEFNKDFSNSESELPYIHPYCLLDHGKFTGIMTKLLLITYYDDNIFFFTSQKSLSFVYEMVDEA